MSDQPSPDNAPTGDRPWWRHPGAATWLLSAAAIVAAVVLIVISSGRESKPAADGDQPTAVVVDGAGVRGPITGIERRRDSDELALGRKDAPVVMVEYSDFRCPFCGRFSRETHPELVRRYVDRGVLRIEWRDFPIFGEQSELAARAARAASRQGRFWEFQEHLYADAPSKGHAKYPKAKLLAAAKAVGVEDLERFEREMQADDVRREVETDRDEGLEIGVNSTPAFVINGTPVLGAQPLEAFVTAIEQARGSDPQ